MKRWDIINRLIKQYGMTRYLEIGTQKDDCLSKIECKLKVGVDPNPLWHSITSSDEFYKMSSDAFFSVNERKFDIVFIDGLHHADQAFKDINNALRVINHDGAIVVHDCSPILEESQRIPEPLVANWNGDVWKAWVRMRSQNLLTMRVINTDHGVGIIQWGFSDTIKIPEEKLTFENLQKNRKEWLNLKEVCDVYAE